MIEVRFSKTAAQHIIDAAINWRTHHPQKPELFNEELQRAIDLLERHPEIGPRARTKRYKEARVLVMRETEHLLVYRRETKRRLRILALHPSRATPERP